MGTLQQTPPIVMLHGLFGNKRNWLNISRHINRMTQRGVYALDLRNHGDSPHSSSISYELMAADVHRFLEENSIQSCAVIGHSMGGRVAMALSLDHPDIVQQMVAVDVAPSKPPNPGIATTCIKGMLNLPLQNVTSRKQAGQLMKEYIEDSRMRDFLVTNLVLRDGHWKWRINLEGIANSTKALTSLSANYFKMKYMKPCFFVGGANSPYLIGDSPQIIRGIFPNAEIGMVPNAGHWVHIDQSESFLTLVTNFLSTAS